MAPIRSEPETYCPGSRHDWRQWLEQHHDRKTSVWIIYFRKSAGKPSLTWSEAVDEALCFGWIDSTTRSLDEERFTQFFCRRKPKSVWSRINKEKVAQLRKQGLMTPAGEAAIGTAKANGSWTILDDVEELSIPADLTRAFKACPGSKAYFNGLSRSVRKSMLQWIVTAKRQETRDKRILEIAQAAMQGIKPKQF